MTRTKKIYGFRLGESIPKWKDRFGRDGGKIIKLIRIQHYTYLPNGEKFQLLISNGDILTSEFMTQDQFYSRGLRNSQ